MNTAKKVSTVSKNWKNENSAYYAAGELNNNPSEVDSDDIAYILENGESYSWDHFYEVLEKEKASGSKNCPQASYIALELLTPRLMQLSYKSTRTNSETYKDLVQDAYVTISEHIADFDRSQSSFKTYISKWFQGLARETRNDGISNYQRKTLGLHVVSTDDMAARNSQNSDSEMSVEFADEKYAIETIVEKKEKARSGHLFQQMIGGDLEADGDIAKRNRYTNAACHHLFLGGIGNMPDEMKDELEGLVLD